MIEDYKQQLVIVHWRDIISTAGWEEVDEVDPPKFITLGWVHSRDDDTLKIGSTLDDEGKPYGITAFPMGCITLIEPFSVP